MRCTATIRSPWKLGMLVTCQNFDADHEGAHHAKVAENEVAWTGFDTKATALMQRKHDLTGDVTMRARTREYQRAARAKKRAEGFAGLTHGTQSTYTAGCRCPKCIDAGRAYNREAQRRSRARRAEDHGA